MMSDDVIYNNLYLSLALTQEHMYKKKFFNNTKHAFHSTQQN